jgi:hypothetical protein
LRENGPQLAEAFARLNACPERLLSPLREWFQWPRLLIAAEVMVPEKTDKTALPMLNGGMAEAGF